MNTPKKTLNRTEEAFYNMLKSVCGDRLDVQFQVAVSQLVRGKSMQSVDFVITAKDTRPLLVIEIDGPHHDTLEQKSKDVYKDSRLFNARIPVARFSANDLPTSFYVERMLDDLLNDRDTLFSTLLSEHNSNKEEVNALTSKSNVFDINSAKTNNGDSVTKILMKEASRSDWVNDKVDSAITQTIKIGFAYLFGVVLIIILSIFVYKVTIGALSNILNSSGGQKTNAHQQSSKSQNSDKQQTKTVGQSSSGQNISTYIAQPVVQQNAAQIVNKEVPQAGNDQKIGNATPPQEINSEHTFCPKNNNPIMKSLVSNRSEIINVDIPARWSVRNDTENVVGIEMLQNGRPVARLALPPSFNFNQPIPGYGFQLTVYQGDSSCIDFLKSKIVQNSSLPNLEKHKYRFSRKITDLEFYENGLFTTLVSSNAFRRVDSKFIRKDGSSFND